MTSQPPPLEFSAVHRDYRAHVLRYVARLIGREEAEDVTQEVFAKVARSLGTLIDSSKLASWIYAVTINTVRDTARARASRVHVVTGDPSVAGGVGPEEAPLSRSPDLGTRTPEENAIRNEMVACYIDFVDQLPPDHRDVYALSELEGLSNADIARRLSLSVDTVKIRLHRARVALNEELRRNCRCYYNDRGELMAEPKSR